MESVHSGLCLGCNNMFVDEEEYLELECTHVEHVACVEHVGRG